MRWLAAEGFGEIDLDSDFVNPTRPIYRGPDVPSSAPDVMIAVTTLSPSMEGNDFVVPIQFRFRGAPDTNSDDVEDLGDDLLRKFRPNGFPMVHTTFGDVKISKVLFRSSGLLGRDGQRRYEFTSTFRFFGRRIAGS